MGQNLGIVPSLVGRKELSETFSARLTTIAKMSVYIRIWSILDSCCELAVQRFEHLMYLPEPVLPHQYCTSVYTQHATQGRAHCTQHKW